MLDSMPSPSAVRQAFRAIPTFAPVAATFTKVRDHDLYPPNPWISLDGHEGDSPLTKFNLDRRKWKSRASKVFSTAGSVGAHFGSVVNTANIAQHAVALGSTLGHIARLEAMASKIKDDGPPRGASSTYTPSSMKMMIDRACRLKGLKAGTRGASLALSAIPDIGMAGSAAGLAVKLVRLGILKATQAADLEMALRLHYRAFRELKLIGSLGGLQGGKGPAISLVHELTTKGLTGTFDYGDLHSPETNNRIMLEPAGYAVILHKLLQN